MYKSPEPLLNLYIVCKCGHRSFTYSVHYTALNFEFLLVRELEIYPTKKTVGKQYYLPVLGFISTYLSLTMSHHIPNVIHQFHG